MAEQQILRLGCNGLTTDPGPFAGVPDGAMVEAQNLMFRRPGVAEPRAPLQFTRDASATGTCYGVFPFDDGSAVVPQWIGFSGWRSGGTTTVTGGFTFSQFQTRHSAYRGRGFFTSDQGIAVLDGASDTSARLAGVPRGPGFWTKITQGIGSGLWLPQDYVIGYRTCVVRSLNGTPSRGAPSSLRYVCNERNTMPGDCYVSIRIYITSDIVAGDYIEVYRCAKIQGTYVAGTQVTDGYPSDEGTLRTSILVTSAIVSAGYVDWDDTLNDKFYSGPYLYTNASQEGIALANERPNYCIDADIYNRMHFFAGQRSPQRVTLTALGIGTPEDKVPNVWGSGLDTQYRLCGYQVAATITSGAATITLAGGEWAYLSVGQYVTDGTNVDPETGTARIPANTQILSINSGTGVVTFTKNATASAGPITLCFYDFLEVDDGSGTKRRIYTCWGIGSNSSTLYTARPKIFVGTPQWHETNTIAVYGGSGGAAEMERAWANAYGTTSFRLAAVAASNSNDYVTIRIERTDASLGSFTVRSSKPLAFDQYVDSVTGVTSSQEGTPGRLAWSKIDEPESAPLPYYADIGDPNAPIYACTAVQDSLYVFKADGLWRVFGDDPQNLVIQQVDTTARVTQNMSNAITRYGNSVYAWTQRGIIEVGNFGVRNVDAPIYNDANAPLGANPAAAIGWACASPYGRWIAFCSGLSGAPAYVYFPELGIWSTWTFRDYIWHASTPLGGTYSSSNVPIFGVTRGYAQASVSWPVPETATASTALCGGDLYSATITGVVGTRVTINSSTLYRPQVGDAIVDVSGVYYVTNVVSFTDFDVDRTGLGTSPTYIYSSYPAKVVWSASSAGNPASVKHYVDSVLMFSRMLQGRSFTERFQGYQNATETTNAVTYDSTGATYATVKPYLRRGHVPKGVGRDWALKFGFTIQQGASFWTLDGGALSYVFAGTRL